ncbi:Cytochrome P450 [Canna indica]|uniref:Cytochrome P450 n=1 Tax=Canna indica TaxID=4628 RepID=A0AAQ3K7Q3_9LILI|nr:Cytochrome P450 [Canna indica]
MTFTRKTMASRGTREVKAKKLHQRDLEIGCSNSETSLGPSANFNLVRSLGNLQSQSKATWIRHLQSSSFRRCSSPLSSSTTSSVAFPPPQTTVRSRTPSSAPSSPFFFNHHRFLDLAADLFAASPAGTFKVRGPLALSGGVVTNRPSVVDHLIRSNFSNYVKGERIGATLSDLLGHGIFNIDGHLWFLQHKIASHEFTTCSLNSFVSDVVRFQLRDRFLPLLSAAAIDECGITVDLQDVLRRFAFDNICTIAFGTDPTSLRVGSGDYPRGNSFYAFDSAVEISSARLFAPIPLIWKLKRFLNVGSERRLKNAIKIIDGYATRVIELKEDQELKKQDLLSRFMAALDEEDNELRVMFKELQQRRKFLRDIVISFILAGKDTTSAGLTWFFWLLAIHPRCEEKIHKEIAELGEEEGEQMGYDELKGMHYLHAAITEALRVYPPVPIDTRVAAANDELPDGTLVKAGWFADYCTYAMAREEQVWGANCREFKPERWLDEKGEFVAAEVARFPVRCTLPRPTFSTVRKQTMYIMTVNFSSLNTHLIAHCHELIPGMSHLIFLIELACYLAFRHNSSIDLVIITDCPSSIFYNPFVESLPLGITFVTLPPLPPPLQPP